MAAINADDLHKLTKIDSNVKIIIYIHICQKGDWKRSFKMIIDKIRESGLYEVSSEIRCGVLNDVSLDLDPIMVDDKINIFYLGTTNKYETPTLLHMKNSNDANAKYLYFHTKGLRWFGTDKEKNVIDCNYLDRPLPHYSENFLDN